jgi:membrane protein implicated in regulation of membrane protease activity
VVSVSMPVGGEGKVTYRGSEWIAFSESGGEIPAGVAVIIVGIEDVKLSKVPDLSGHPHR